LAASALMLGSGAAFAKPAFAEKEKKPCGYCHVNPAGGGARNARGIYYQTHNFSFEGYVEPLTFKRVWRVDAPASATRIAVADVLGDKKPRVLTVGDGDQLAIHSIEENALKQAATVAVKPVTRSEARKMVALRPKKNQPAVIALPGAVLVKEGDTLVSKAASSINDITGRVILSNGEEAVFLLDGLPVSWSVDDLATGRVINGPDIANPLENPRAYRLMQGRIAPDLLQSFGIPEAAAKRGTFLLWDIVGKGKLFAVFAWVAADGDRLSVFDPDALAFGATPKPEWQSEKLDGQVLDLVLGEDPADPEKHGIYVLLATGEDKKAKVIEFYKLAE
jgi:hypothetical protein